jgi:hypothetical protein
MNVQQALDRSRQTPLTDDELCAWMEFAFRPYRLRVVERFCGCLYRANVITVLLGYVILLERLDQCQSNMLPCLQQTGELEPFFGQPNGIKPLELDDNFFGPGFVLTDD